MTKYASIFNGLIEMVLMDTRFTENTTIHVLVTNMGYSAGQGDWERKYYTSSAYLALLTLNASGHFRLILSILSGGLTCVMQILHCIKGHCGNNLMIRV